jgi:hypothetical protein
MSAQTAVDSSPDELPLLEAKLAQPRPRARLFDALDRLESSELTVVSGPAGSGKTVLVSSWLAARPDLATAWATLDPSDDDPVHLWTYVSCVWQALEPTPCQGCSWRAARKGDRVHQRGGTRGRRRTEPRSRDRGGHPDPRRADRRVGGRRQSRRALACRYRRARRRDPTVFPPRTGTSPTIWHRRCSRQSTTKHAPSC